MNKIPHDSELLPHVVSNSPDTKPWPWPTSPSQPKPGQPQFPTGPRP